jgi:hypothetical protein
MAAEIKDGIADDLTRAVEGDIATAITFEKLDAALGEGFGGGDDICGFRVAAQRDDWFVLEQEKDVADFFFFAEVDEPPLQAQARGVIYGAELDDRDQMH